MPGLALHNFRGFQKTLIPFGQVNFFVGENSTGKTSVLSALEILSTMDLFYRGELTSEYCDFSAYEDAATISDSVDTFSLGYFRSAYSKVGLLDVIALHFKNDNGRTGLSELVYVMNGFLVRARFKRDRALISINKAILGDGSPQAIIAELMWGRFSRVKGESVKNCTYLEKELKTPSLIISALNVITLENIKGDSDAARSRFKINPAPFPSVHWGAPIRAKPERINSISTRQFTPEGAHIPSLIRQAYGSQRDNYLEERLDGYVKGFGSESHLFNDLVVKEYGTGHASPYEIRIKFRDEEHKLSNVGYGVSQALPVLIDVAAAADEEGFVIQQPEVHLHPRAQAAFGEFFFDMALRRNHTFFIETHSDFLIDRFRLMLNKSRAKKKPVAVIYFFHKCQNGNNNIQKIDISSNGAYASELPDEYKDFFFKEELELLEIR